MTSEYLVRVPEELALVVQAVSYKPLWSFRLRTEFEEDESGGLKLQILSESEDSIRTGHRIRVLHSFLVPNASYNIDVWTRWVFERILDVEQHEAAEFFKIDGYRQMAPHHGNGEDPYMLWNHGTEAQMKKRAGDD